MFRVPVRNMQLIFSFLLTTTLASCNQVPGYTVVGQLSDPDGNPLERKEIMLGRYINFADQFHSFSVPYKAGYPYASTTDDDGEFQIFAETSGYYLLLYQSEKVDVGLQALTDKKGHIVILELSETQGADVGRVFLANYQRLPKRYLPDFLDDVSLGMASEDLESQQTGLIKTDTTGDHDLFETAHAENGVDKVVYAFEKSNRQLDKLEIWYTDENGAFTFGETNFGIPNYQGLSSNDKSVIHWYFNHGNERVDVIANGSRLTYQILY